MNFLATISYYLPVLAPIGTYLLILAHSKKHLPERVKKNGIESEGTVVEVRKNGRNEYLVVDFAHRHGTFKHFSNEFASTSPFRVGQKVKLWYYFYKSINEVVVEGEDVGNLPAKFYRWGIIFCIIGYPFVLSKLIQLT